MSNMNNKYKKNICINCGNKGHDYKNCDEPVISSGIIAIKIDGKFDTDTLSDGKEIDTLPIQANDMKDLEKFCNIKDKIQFLMVRRKDTLGYSEFIRGRYVPDNCEAIIFLFEQMTQDEINKIAKCTFDELWVDFWGIKNTSNTYFYEREYQSSKEKFNLLKKTNKKYNILGLDFYTTNVKPDWEVPEWGFPKGRRDKVESDLECAKREFKEEAGFDINDIVLINKPPLVEDLIGTNGVRYRHNYYLALVTSGKKLEISESQKNEIGDIGYFTYEEAISKIRPYHTEKKIIVTKLYNHIINKLLLSNEIE